MRRIASNECQHALELVETNAERRSREDQNPPRVLLLPFECVAESRVLAFRTMCLVNNEQVTS